MDNFYKEGIGDTQSMPTTFLVFVPGICHTHTTAASNAQALSYALRQSFETRNRYFWEGTMYEGENGLAALTENLLRDPRTMVDWVQALPGTPSKPISIPLPMASTPQMPAPAPAPSMAQASFHRSGPTILEVVPVYSDDLRRVASYTVKSEFNKVLGRVVHEKSGWHVLSEDGRNFGPYDSKDKAVEKLKTVEWYGHKRGWLKK